jgi:hypothetical protein
VPPWLGRWRGLWADKSSESAAAVRCQLFFLLPAVSGAARPASRHASSRHSRVFGESRQLRTSPRLISARLVASRPYPSERMEVIAISSLVSSPDNEGPELIEPVPA